jgi:Asp-tRNA(Asn)/Glu-tRNA(Gln) amidotransferase C subunit
MGIKKEKNVLHSKLKHLLSCYQAQLNELEKYLDQLFKVLNVDVAFTKHFLDRVNDSRNGKPITVDELQLLFKKTIQKYGKKIPALGPDAEAVLNDMKTQINLPFVLKWDRDAEELDLVAKTVMRKKNFMTHNQKFTV